MTPGELIVILALAGAAGLAVRSLWKQHKSGRGCTGNCASCCGCGHAAPKQSEAGAPGRERT